MGDTGLDRRPSLQSVGEVVTCSVVDRFIRAVLFASSSTLTLLTTSEYISLMFLTRRATFSAFSISVVFSVGTTLYKRIW